MYFDLRLCNMISKIKTWITCVYQGGPKLNHSQHLFNEWELKKIFIPIQLIQPPLNWSIYEDATIN